MLRREPGSNHTGHLSFTSGEVPIYALRMPQNGFPAFNLNHGRSTSIYLGTSSILSHRSFSGYPIRITTGMGSTFVHPQSRISSVAQVANHSNISGRDSRGEKKRNNQGTGRDLPRGPGPRYSWEPRGCEWWRVATRTRTPTWWLRSRLPPPASVPVSPTICKDKREASWSRRTVRNSGLSLTKHPTPSREYLPLREWALTRRGHYRLSL